MKIFVGERPSRFIRNFAELHGWGQMFIYEDPNRYAGELWAHDNGAFLDWMNGREFDEDRYLRSLETAWRVAVEPHFAVVPDLVGQGLKSLDFSLRWVDRMPRKWRLYLAIQDGMETSDVAPVLRLFNGLFLGGTDRLKRQAGTWCDFAHENFRLFHFARAGTEGKIKTALRIGADSLDSSFPLWTRPRLARMEYLVNEWRYREPGLFTKVTA